jgi:ribosomal protein S18 acetylase RimI-like enzyme
MVIRETRERTTMVMPLIRPVRVCDVDAIVSINEEARGHGYSDSGFLVAPLTAQTVLAELEDDRADYASEEGEGEVVGFLKYSTRSLEGYQSPTWIDEPVDLVGGIHIERVAVRASHRGKGIGTSLYADLYRRCDAAFLYTYVIVAPCPNTASIGFHEARGFRSVAHVPYALDDGSWFMERLYLQNDPARLAGSGIRSKGFITRLHPGHGLLDGARLLLEQELGSGYVTADRLLALTRGTDDGVVLAWLVGTELAGVGIASAAACEEIDAARRCGFTSAEPVGCVQTLVVDPRYRRSGGGSVLAGRLLALLRADGYATNLLFAWASGSGSTADGIAKRLGFECLGTLEEYWREDSVERGYNCPVCGNPCLCDVNVWVITQDVLPR